MYYKDRNIINNSSLACFLIILFIEEFEKKSLDKRSPDLLLFLLILPFAWHKISRETIKNKKSTTVLDAVIQENPLIKANFDQRVSNYAGPTLQGLNLAVASGLVTKIEIENIIQFKRSTKKWPSNVKKTLPDDMSKTIVRLANWFHQMDTPQIYNFLLGN